MDVAVRFYYKIYVFSLKYKPISNAVFSSHSSECGKYMVDVRYLRDRIASVIYL